MSPITRVRLKLGNNRPYLDRWSVGSDKRMGVMLHKISAPDPGQDLHDHPWWFVSLVLRGGYTEYRMGVRNHHGAPGVRRRWSIRLMPLSEAHRIIAVEPNTWTLILRGPRCRYWGFFTPWGWTQSDDYFLIHPERREVFNPERNS